MPAAYIENEAEFDSLLASESLLVIDCTAAWCGPCRLVAPLMDQLADEYSGQAKVMKVDLDNNREIANRYQVRSIPAVMFFKDGEVAETLVGKKPYGDYVEALTKHLS